MRSNQIIGFRSQTTPVEDTAQVTGNIYINTKEGDEITVFQALVPIAKTAFDARFAALETALNEPWFEMPTDVEYRP